MSVAFGIRGTGSAVPDKVLSNDDLSVLVDTSDEWIVQRTGIKERRILPDGMTTSDLCIEASNKALADAGLAATDIDMVILATVTPDRNVPATACKIQHALGCRKVPAFDMAAGCTGFVYAATIAQQFLANGTMENILVIGAEGLSRIVNYADRASCIIFGDGAGAVIFGRDFQYGQVLTSGLEADGGGYDVMYQLSGGAERPTTQADIDARDDKLVIRGREVYKFAVNRMVALVRAELEKHPELELGGVIPHQVNMRIIESARERLEMPEDRIYVNIERYGNTSAASVPVALDEARRDGFFEGQDGKLIVLCAFGAGLTWGSMGLKW